MREATLGLLKLGPLGLLQRTATVYAQRQQPDFRAKLTLHGSRSEKWTGVPALWEQSHEGGFVLLRDLDQKHVVLLPLNQITAVEIEDPDVLEQYFSKPWLRESRYASLSRMQAAREIEAVAKELGLNILASIEGFPNPDEAPGAVLAWMHLLKAELQRIGADPAGKTALAEIKSVEVSFQAGPLSCAKKNGALYFKIDLSPDNFDPKAVEDALNSSL